MTVEEMARGISIHREAADLKKKIESWVLLAIDQSSKPEVVNVGDPVTYKKAEYYRTEIKISDEIRRLAFRQWRKGLTLKFNDLVRELNRLGVSHDFQLIRFNPSTGEPL